MKIEMMLPQAKKLSEAGERHGEDPFQCLQGEHSPASTLISDF